MMGTRELAPTSKNVTLSVPSWPWAAPPQLLPNNGRKHWKRSACNFPDTVTVTKSICLLSFKERSVNAAGK